MDEYNIKTVEEGLTKIQFPEFDKISSDAPVFYNPHMELNRDISILALQTFQKQENQDITICDLFGGSGIRGVRYKNEIEKWHETPSKTFTSVYQFIDFFKNSKTWFENNI